MHVRVWYGNGFMTQTQDYMAHVSAGLVSHRRFSL